MNVKFDYYTASVLGHKARCEILQAEIVRRGHTVVSGETIPSDWIIYDHPNAPTDIAYGQRRLLMGQYNYHNSDYSWHPLGASHVRTLTGSQYIIVNPEIANITPTHQFDILITCGGADPFYLSERLIDLFADYNPTALRYGIVIGPNVKRRITAPSNWLVYNAPSPLEMLNIMAQYHTVIAAWGNTTFEALALGARVLAITTQPEHNDEVLRLSMFSKTGHVMPYVTRWDEFNGIINMLPDLTVNNYGIDTHGATRTVIALEQTLDGIYDSSPIN